ncbi:MAG: hypothetical protein AB7G12_17455 [Thermoanaerobaculia bacterium]
MPDRPARRMVTNPGRIGLLLVLVAAGATAEDSEPDFSFRGQPIPPQCLESFSTGGAEAPPRATIVELDACAGATATKASPPPWQAGPDGRRSYRRVHDGRAGGTFGYRPRGRTSEGLSVLETWDNDGGSGTSTELLLVRREESRLVLVRSIPGGDRCLAGISATSIQGADVAVDFRLGAADLVAWVDDLAASRIDETPELDPGTGTPYDCEGSARYLYAPATSPVRRLLGIDYRPSVRVLHGDGAEARCLRRAFGTADAFFERVELQEAARALQACLAASSPE